VVLISFHCPAIFVRIQVETWSAVLDAMLCRVVDAEMEGWAAETLEATLGWVFCDVFLF
jgi:hypothetical protein